LDFREYRIVQGQDSAAALVVDGRIVAAAAEERFNGKKHSSDLPADAIRFCVQEAGLSMGDIDAFVHGFDYHAYRVAHSLNPYSKKRYREVYAPESVATVFRDRLGELPDGSARLRRVEHHKAHAASAYYTSGWDNCLVLVLDGMGEVHSVTAWLAKDGQLQCIHRQSADNSIGVLYSLVTLHLGFDFNSDEYKIMGLAPYGDPAVHRSFFENNVELLEDGQVRIPFLSLDRSPEEREVYARPRDHLAQHLIPARDPNEDVTDAHRNAAAALQECLNRSILHICTHFAKATGQRKLAMAGGVALNCTANGKLLYSGTFDEIYVQPAAADDGTALGAALAYAAEHDEVHNQRMTLPFLGPAYTQAECDDALAAYEDRVRVTHFASLEETCAEAARRIASGQVIAWSRGRMEYGPRALGNRSILADPGHAEMRDRVNAMVKKREAFRPFAPAVTLETAHEWFDIEAGTELPYMIMIVDVREEHRDALPAITHVNGSARVQTVSEQGHPDFHALLRATGKTTGREMLLNTSFNVKGQPMVNSPVEAIETFLGTGIDALFLENALVTRG